MIMRIEEPKDYKTTENITREAFWNLNSLGCNEHYLLNIMRSDKSFIKELSLVAEEGNKIVGHIAYSKAVVKKHNNTELAVICFGPISVLPEYQNKGIGKELIEHSFIIAKELGYGAVVIYGSPEYYHKRGFVSASKFGISRSDGIYAPTLMAHELVDGYLDNANGSFYEAEIFEKAGDITDEYDSQFPFKEKFETETQKEFLRQVALVEKPPANF